MTTQQQTFIFEDETGFIKGVSKEKTFKKFYFNLPMGEVKVLITEEKEYFNIYIITDHFKQEPLNCLQNQEPKENIKEPQIYFNEKYAEFKAIEFYLWYKYGNPSKDEVLSFSIQEYK